MYWWLVRNFVIWSIMETVAKGEGKNGTQAPLCSGSAEVYSLTRCGNKRLWQGTNSLLLKVLELLPVQSVSAGHTIQNRSDQWPKKYSLLHSLIWEDDQSKLMGNKSKFLHLRERLVQHPSSNKKVLGTNKGAGLRLFKFTNVIFGFTMCFTHVHQTS